MYRKNLITFIIFSLVNISFTCKRSIIDSKDGIIINICPETKKECISWMYIERMANKQHHFDTLGTFIYPSMYLISDSSKILNFTLDTIRLVKWDKGDLFHIPIGIHKTCKHNNGEDIETIYVDETLLLKENDSNENDNTAVFVNTTTNKTKHFFQYYKTYLYIVAPICTIFILIIVTYITCNKACFFKKQIRKIDDIEDFIMIKLHQEKEPLFHRIDETEDSEDDDY
ncbi:SWPV1-250 [Shearwaterpox virus]|uniref:SWPV1-250 n=1 Tax=Shearwaterpox virus TaxID=1974596 RepID=A0A1V0S857_CNPV|nr:SWPV1-250 [Shearwaterpox virus]